MGIRPDDEIARKSGYNSSIMDVSIADAKNRLPELIRAVEAGEKVVITRHGKPVAQITPPPPERRPIQWGAMRDRMKLRPGWNDPITVDELLGSDG
jgi:prevent-host-death family protein